MCLVGLLQNKHTHTHPRCSVLITPLFWAQESMWLSTDQALIGSRCTKRPPMNSAACGSSFAVHIEWNTKVDLRWIPYITTANHQGWPLREAAGLPSHTCNIEGMLQSGNCGERVHSVDQIGIGTFAAQNGPVATTLCLGIIPKQVSNHLV